VAESDKSPKLIDDNREQLARPDRVAGLVQKQLFFGVAAAGLIAFFWQVQAGMAVFFGVVLMLANAIYLGRCVTALSGLDAESEQRSLYKGAAIRFAGLVAGLILAGFLGLNLLFVGLGIFVAQAVLYFSALHDLNREKV